MIRNAILPKEGLQSDGLLTEHVVWLLDSLFSLFELCSEWLPAVDLSTMTLVEFALGVASAPGDFRGFDAVIYTKAHSLLVVLCAGVVKNPREILGDDEHGAKARQRFCVALVKLAKAGIKHKPISRLIKGQLLAPLKILTTDNLLFGTGTDIWVRVLTI